MVRRSFRFGLRMGVLAGAIYAVVRTLQSRRPPVPAPATPSPVTRAPQPAAPVQPASPRPAAPSRPTPSRPAPAPRTEQPGEPDVGPVVDTPDVAEPAADVAPPQPPPAAPRAGTAPPAAPERPLRATRAEPVSPQPTAPPRDTADGPLWVEPTEGVCPPSHPVKAKLASRIFHIPGGQNYARTRADRCYKDPASATADGLRPAAR